MHPELVEEAQTQTQAPYINNRRYSAVRPFGPHRSLGLISRLSPIQESAAKWIRQLEEETTGKPLALGDIKSLMAKILGVEKNKEHPGENKMDWIMTDGSHDPTRLDNYRNDI